MSIFQIIYPIGIRCTADEILKKLDMKNMSSIFGSLNIKNFNNIVKCIESNFNILTNENNIISSKNIPSMINAPYVRTLHKLFDNLENWDSSTIAHYDLTTEKDMNHILRCIERFNKLRDNNIPTLFFNISIASEYDNTKDTEKVVDIFHNTNWTNFHIIFIYFNEKSEKEINKIFCDKFKTIYVISDTCNTNSDEYDKGALYFSKILKEFNIGNLLTLTNINNLKESVTVVLTSCNRPIELTITLRSFFKFNTYPVKFIIVDDSGINGCIDEAIKEIPNNIEKKIIYNEVNIGQCKSIDKAYDLVDTEYILHCEDDWEFTAPNFIEESLKILKQDRKIFSVVPSKYSNNITHPQRHPIKPNVYNNSYKLMNSFKERSNIWYGFTFNPSLRRTQDAKMFFPYEQYSNSPLCNVGGIEQALNHLYNEKGFIFAISLNNNGFVKHIGGNNPCPRNY